MAKESGKSRVRLFLENMIVYGLGSVLGKIIPFALLPVITRMLPSTYYYGISDLVEVIVSFGASFSAMGLYDIMFRFFFEKEDEYYRKTLCSSTLTFVLVNAGILGGGLILLREPIARLIFRNNQYSNLVVIAAISIFFSAISLIVAAPTRMKNKKELYLGINAVIPLISYSIAILLLKLGVYEYALPIVTLCNYLLLTVIFLVINHNHYDLKLCDWKLVRQMLKLGIPLVPNFVIYWIFNSSDKFMINYMLGTEAAGVYGVGAKLGHLSQLIYTAFAGGWQYFAFSTMKDKDQVQLTSKVFEYLGVLTYISSIGITCLSKLIFGIMFTEEYSEGYLVMPYMFLAPLLLMLYQTAGNQFLIIKKTWPTMVILMFGAVANLFFNFIFIPVIGIEGAAIGTLLGYIVSVLVCAMVLIKMKLLEVQWRFWGCSFLMLGFLVIWRVFTNQCDVVYILTGVLMIASIIYLYRRDLVTLWKLFARKGDK